jgi:hypothetical protein
VFCLPFPFNWKYWKDLTLTILKKEKKDTIQSEGKEGEIKKTWV